MDVVWRIPFTLTLLVAMGAGNWLAGTWSGRLPLPALTRWGISHQSVVQGEVFRLLTGVFLSHDRGMLVRQVLLTVTVVGFYEWTMGTMDAFLMFWTIDIAGSLLVLFAVLPVIARVRPDSGLAHLHSLDVGMSAGGFGLIGAILWMLPNPWIWLVLALLAIAVKVWAKCELIADATHAVCLILGFATQGLVQTA